jgi:hypothetical protein
LKSTIAVVSGANSYEDFKKELESVTKLHGRNYDHIGVAAHGVPIPLEKSTHVYFKSGNIAFGELTKYIGDTVKQNNFIGSAFIAACFSTGSNIYEELGPNDERPKLTIYDKNNECRSNIFTFTVYKGIYKEGISGPREIVGPSIPPSKK